MNNKRAVSQHGNGILQSTRRVGRTEKPFLRTLSLINIREACFLPVCRGSAIYFDSGCLRHDELAREFSRIFLWTMSQAVLSN